MRKWHDYTNCRDKMKEIELLYCPFCGYDKPILHESLEYPETYTVYCPNCGARIGDEDEWGTDKYEAIILWNQRTTYGREDAPTNS